MFMLLVCVWWWILGAVMIPVASQAKTCDSFMGKSLLRQPKVAF